MKALRGNQKLLVVDDIAANRELLIRYFGARGFQIAEADGGSAAMGMIKQQHFDAVLLDIMMPEIDGIEVLKRIRASYKPADLPVIMVSALNGQRDVRLALDLGANDYVTKPVDLVLALTKLQRVLGDCPVQLAKPVVKTGRVEPVNNVKIQLADAAARQKAQGDPGTQGDPGHAGQSTENNAQTAPAAAANLNRREMRRKARRQLQRSVWVFTDKQVPPIRCTTVDLSASGACVIFQNDQDLPNRFTLSLTESGTAPRVCRLVWRNGLRVGLEFTGEMAEIGEERPQVGGSINLLL